MKKVRNALILFVAALALFGLSGCKLPAFLDGSAQTAQGESRYDAASLNVAKSDYIVSANENYYEKVESFHDENYNYWIFDMGRIQNVPLEETVTYFPYTGGNVQHKFTVSSTTSESVKRLSETAASQSSSWSEAQSVSAKLTISGGKKDVFSVGMEGGYSYMKTNGSSVASSWKESFENCAQKSVTEEHTVVITFDPSCAFGYYRYIMLGVVNLYVGVVQNRSTGEYNADCYTEIYAYGYALQYDPDSALFESAPVNKIDFDLSFINDLEEPTEFIPSAVLNPVREPLTVFEGRIRSGSKKINGSGAYTLDNFKINETVSQLIEKEYESLEFSIKFEIKEVDDCKQFVTLFTSTDKELRNETIYHGGAGKADKSWGTHELNCTVPLSELDSNSFNFRCQAENKIFRDFYIGNVDVKVIAR